jgi:hypothetical protein
MALPTPERIEKARLAVKQAKARLQAIENRQSEAGRKLETRRKIILGGLLLDAAEKDEKFARALQVLVGRVSRDQDAKAFEGWQQPRPATPVLAPAPASTPAEAPAKFGQEGKDILDFSHVDVSDRLPRSLIPE